MTIDEHLQLVLKYLLSPSGPERISGRNDAARSTVLHVRIPRQKTR